MTRNPLLALTTAALLAAGSAFAGPNCDKNCPKDGTQDDVYEVRAEGEKKGGCKNKDRDGSDDGVYEVAEREGMEGKEGKRERGERPERKRPNPMKDLGLTETQQEEAKAIFASAREEAKELMEDLKAKKEAGEEIDRESVREQMMAIRKGAMDEVYETVLNDEQRAKVDERRAKMEERRAQRESEGGERPERKGKGEKRDRGGDDGLDL
ncbi:MAG: hypothetical protein AAGB26_18420 [Planctomycetota bacterium]